MGLSLFSLAVLTLICSKLIFLPGQSLIYVMSAPVLV